MSEERPWKVINGELINIEGGELLELKNHFSVGFFVDKNNPENIILNLLNVPEIAKFAKPFPRTVWTIDHEKGILGSHLEIAKFLEPFPLCVFKIIKEKEEDELILFMQHYLAWFKEPFPLCVWHISRDENLRETSICIGRLEELLGAFAHTKNITEIRIPVNVTDISDNSFQNSGLKKVYIHKDCLYNPQTTFPKNCEIIYYD